MTDRYSGLASSLGRKAPVRAATTANITLTGLQTIDGVALAAGDRVLVKNQSTSSQNGIYNASTGVWTRAKDFNGTADAVKGTAVFVSEGTAAAGREYYVTTAAPQIGTTALAWGTRTEGLPGDAGVSVTSATVNGLGHLLIGLSNSTTLDAGSVLGPAGAAGVPDGTLFDNLAAVEAATIPGTVSTIAIGGARTPGDAGPPMACRRADPLPATWSTTDREAGITLSGGNLVATWASAGEHELRATLAHEPPASGSYYVEFTAASANGGVGLSNDIHNLGTGWIGGDANTFGWFGTDGSVWHNFASVGTAATYGAGDVLGIELLPTSAKLYKNGTLVYTFTSLPSGALYPTAELRASGESFTLNLGSSFAHRPSGALDWTAGTPATPSGFVQSADGALWEYLNTGSPARVEWFGGYGDYDVVDQITGLATANPTPTDNHDPYIRAATWRFVAKPNYSYVGQTVEFGPGGYYFGSTVDFNDIGRQITTIGHGLSQLNGPTRFIWPAGTKGLYLPINCRAVFKYIDFFCLGHGGQTTKHGIHVETPFTMEHCSVTGFGGNGVDIAADAGATPTSNANLWYIGHCTMQNNAVNGLSILGGDGNAGSSQACNFINNGGYGLKDISFLGNGHADHHTQGNTLGAYYIANHGNTRCALINCYSENDQPWSYFDGAITVIGGLHAAPITLAGGATFMAGDRHSGGLYFTPPSSLGSTPDGGDGIGLGLRTEPGTLMRFGKSASVYGHDWRYYADEGYMLNWANLGGNWAFGITPEEGSTRRNPRIPVNHFLVPNSLYVGSAYNTMRRLFTAAAIPNEATLQSLKGDLALATDGRSLGWSCYNPDADGVPGTAAKWARSGPLFFENWEQWNPSALTNNTSTAVRTISVPGARVGDYPSLAAAALQGVEANVWIDVDDVISYQLHNRTGGTVTLANPFYVAVRSERSVIF